MLHRVKGQAAAPKLSCDRVPKASDAQSNSYSRRASHRYFAGETGSDVQAIDAALDAAALRMPGAVLTEMPSFPKAGPKMAGSLASIPVLAASNGYWERAGEARRKVLKHGFKARVADALIAQACIDNGVPLISRDADFRHFVKHCGLVLA